jgi:hypothetical protein
MDSKAFFTRTTPIEFPQKCVVCLSEAVAESFPLDYGNHRLEETGAAGKVGDVIGKGVGGIVGGVIGSAVGASIKSKWEVKIDKAQVPFCSICKSGLAEPDFTGMSVIEDIQKPPVLDNAAFRKEHIGDQVTLQFKNPAYLPLFLTANQGRVSATLEQSQRKATAQSIRMWIFFAIIMIPIMFVLWVVLDKGMSLLSR